MAFHVEIRRGLHHARAFNLEHDELQRTVLEPWLRGVAVTVGQRQWDPGACRLTVLEGPRLAPADLAHGQGWHNAGRSARDVTAAVLTAVDTGAATVAVIAATAEDRDAAAAAVEALGLTAVDFAAVRAGRTVRAGLVVVGTGALTVGWGLDAGLAMGTLGARAIVVCLGDAPMPGELAGIEPVRLGAPDALAARLCQAAAGTPKRTGTWRGSTNTG